MGNLNEAHIQHAFDSYCKKVVRNEALNIQKQYARFRKRQISMNLLAEKGLDNRFYYLDSNLDNSDAFTALGMEILITDSHLSDAISKLSPERREIILLSFFIGLNDREIGEVIGKSLGSVWYQRQAAMEEMGKILGVVNEER